MTIGIISLIYIIQIILFTHPILIIVPINIWYLYIHHQSRFENHPPSNVICPLCPYLVKISCKKNLWSDICAGILASWGSTFSSLSSWWWCPEWAPMIEAILLINDQMSIKRTSIITKLQLQNDTISLESSEKADLSI